MSRLQQAAVGRAYGLLVLRHNHPRIYSCHLDGRPRPPLPCPPILLRRTWMARMAVVSASMSACGPPLGSLACAHCRTEPYIQPPGLPDVP